MMGDGRWAGHDRAVTVRQTRGCRQRGKHTSQAGPGSEKKKKKAGGSVRSLPCRTLPMCAFQSNTTAPPTCTVKYGAQPPLISMLGTVTTRTWDTRRVCAGGMPCRRRYS